MPFPLVLRLALRDLHGGMRGMRILAACLALGVFAIAAAGSTQMAVEDGLQRDGQTLLGGDLELRLTYRSIIPQQRAVLDEHGTVTQGRELRVMARSESADGALHQTLVELKTVDAAYPLFGQVSLRNDSRDASLAQALARQPDGLWGVAVEPALLARLHLAVGDLLQVGQASMRVTAVISKEPDRVATVISFGPRLMMQDQALEATDLLQPGALVRQVTRLKITDGTAPSRVAAILKDRFPEAGWRLRMVDQAAPGLQRFFTQIATYLTLVGLTALLVGGIGVANAVRAYLNARTATIAIFKSLGASSGQVFWLYLIQITAMALTGVLIGVVLGAVVPWAAAPAISPLLPFDLPVGIYPRPLLEAAVFGLLTAWIFALLPLLRARTTPAASLFRTAVLGSGDDDAASLPIGARARTIGWTGWLSLGIGVLVLVGLVVAVNDHKPLAGGFVIGSAVALALFRVAATGIMRVSRWLAGLPSVAVGHPGLRMALSNLYRPGSQTPSLVVSMGLGVAVLVTVALIETNLTHQIEDRLPEEGPAFYFIDIQPSQRDAFAQAVASVPGAHVLNTADMVRGRVIALKGKPVRIEDVAPEARWALQGDRGLSSAADQPANAEVIAGSWWAPDYAGPPLVSVAANLAQGLGITVGDQITLNVLGRDISLRVANLREVDWTTLSMNFAFVVSPGTLRGAPVTWIATVAAPPAAEEAVQRAVVDVGSNISAIGVRQALESVDSVLQQAGLTVRATAAVTVLAGALVLGGAMAAGYRRRQYESVILKVLGAERRTVLTTHLTEYAILGLVSGVVSLLVGGVAAWAVLHFVMHMDWTFMPQVAGAVLLLCIGLVVVVGLASTWQALSAKAAPLLRQE